jgi:hypothetical protein
MPPPPATPRATTAPQNNDIAAKEQFREISRIHALPAPSYLQNP